MELNEMEKRLLFRLFLTDAGYQKFLDSQEQGEVKLKNHAKVSGGHLHYDCLNLIYVLFFVFSPLFLTIILIIG